MRDNLILDLVVRRLRNNPLARQLILRRIRPSLRNIRGRQIVAREVYLNCSRVLATRLVGQLCGQTAKVKVAAGQRNNKRERHVRHLHREVLPHSVGRRMRAKSKVPMQISPIALDSR